jgi:hypothetical protein
MTSPIKEIVDRASAATLVPKESVCKTFSGGEFTMPSLEGRVRKELTAKMDELFRGVEGHPQQMVLLTGMLYELIALLDAKGLVSMEELSNRFVLDLVGKPEGFNVGYTMGQRSYRGLGTDQL